MTPEFPNGTWAYFITITSSGTSYYPYTAGRWYYGNPTGGTTTTGTMNADTPLTQYYLGGANSALSIATPAVASGTVAITWSSVAGGSYTVDASPNESTWTNKNSGTTASGTSTSATYTAIDAGGEEYGRVNRTALASYDSNGQTAATVAQSGTVSYLLSSPPVITTVDGSQTVNSGQSVTLSITASGSGALTYQWYSSGSAISSATNSSYTISDPTIASSGSYTVTVTDEYDLSTSDTYTLNVNNAVPTMSLGVLALLAIGLLLVARRHLSSRVAGRH